MISSGYIEKYFDLYEKFEEGPVELKEVASALKIEKNHAKVLMHRLNRSFCSVQAYRGAYYLLSPDKWVDIAYSIEKYPRLKKMFTEISSNLPNLEMLVVYGSQTRGDSQKASDIDLFIVFGDTAPKGSFADVKGQLNIKGQFSIEASSNSGLWRELQEDPLLIYTILYEGDALIGQGLFKFLASVEYDFGKLKDKLMESLAVLDECGEFLRGSYDGETLETIAYSATLRLRTAFLIKGIVMKGPLSKKSLEEDFRNYYKDTKAFEKIFNVYKAVRDEEWCSTRYLDGKELMGYIKAVKSYSMDALGIVENAEKKKKQARIVENAERKEKS